MEAPPGRWGGFFVAARPGPDGRGAAWAWIKSRQGSRKDGTLVAGFVRVRPQLLKAARVEIELEEAVRTLPSGQHPGSA